MMKTKKIITNLRIDHPDWLQIKAIAGELGISVNQYLNFLIKSVSQRRELAEEIITDLDQLPIWKLGKIVVGKAKGLSKDDQLVYR